MFNATAKTSALGLTKGNVYTVFEVKFHDADGSASFLVSVNGNFKVVSMDNFTAQTYSKQEEENMLYARCIESSTFHTVVAGCFYWLDESSRFKDGDGNEFIEVYTSHDKTPQHWLGVVQYEKFCTA